MTRSICVICVTSITLIIYTDLAEKRDIYIYIYHLQVRKTDLKAYNIDDKSKIVIYKLVLVYLKILTTYKE